ncbi:cytochrome P450 [Solirubrobacter sp. CPCC 204708]|uniref:Cytochrome P450 n=1 Tax=Solirubrobacter deserti TaxID=2282478 RepID=A0ABT4RGH6_9ACTN|nr:cytochrome P450 [Solirubrobacter deserti]MBE2318132.1 cytochrome P450 [Solirubrobacter deserti]MDA0137410.1 cytochrome P450 [Solirubrobacter deserti]
MTLPPGPPRPHLAQTVGWLTRPGPYSRRLRERYGDVFTIHVEQRAPWVMLGHPDHVKQVFTGDPNVLHAGEGNNILKPLLGARSVLLLDGSEHMQHRKALLPPFHGERMQAYGDMIRAIANEEVAGWPVGTPLATRLRTQELTLEIIMRAVFGSRDQRLRDALHGLLEFVGRTSVLVLSVLGGKRANTAVFDRVRVPIDALLGELITARRADPDLSEHADILSMLLAGTDMDDATLKDELLTLLVAGHETTATALAWALERLARHPGAWARLREGDDDYVDAVCKETLRLRPVLPGVIRLLKAPYEIAGYTLPAGVAVVPSIHLIHTRADIYPDPLAFRPERFLEKPPGTYTWIPFGGGVRRCLGASFALFEMRWVLRAIADAVVELQPGTTSAEDTKHRSITLAPKADGRVIVARRAAPARRGQPVPSGR